MESQLSSDSEDDDEFLLNKTVIEKQIPGKASTDDRLDKLESMILKLSENVMLVSDSYRCHRSSSLSSVDSTSSDGHRHSSRSRSPSKLDLKYSYDQVFMDEDFKVSNFQDVMLSLFKTFCIFLEEDCDISGLVDHGQFLAEKVSANVYVTDAFVQFDKYTRNVASRKGPEIFDHLSEMERNRYFSLENYRDVQAFRGKMKGS